LVLNASQSVVMPCNTAKRRKASRTGPDGCFAIGLGGQWYAADVSNSKNENYVCS